MTQQQTRDWTNCMSCKHIVHGPHDEPDIIVCSHHTGSNISKSRDYTIEDAINFLESRKQCQHGINYNTSEDLPPLEGKPGSTSFWNNPTFIMSNITKFSGKITFYEDQIRINMTNGIDPTYTSDPG
jgi:hypothetical protein